MKTFTVNEKNTLKKFTDDVCAPASFCFRTLLKGKNIRVNGVRTDRDLMLNPGDVVQYYLTPRQESKTGYTVLYEDENVIVADKESGVNAEAVFSSLSERGETYFIHRIDRNTEGVMIFAKNRDSEEELLACFKEQRTKKIYLAAVAGRMPKPHAVEEAYLTKDSSASVVHISAEPVGEKIVTEYEVMEENGEFSLLRVTLHTGKTHQIRAHLAYLNHPVLGDEKYGDNSLNRRLHLTRQKLLAKELTLFPKGKLAYLSGKSYLSPKKVEIPQKNA